MRKEERYSKVLDWFMANMPEAETELHYKNSFELLVAVILSAQCTDKRVNLVTPKLFQEFPTPHHLSLAKVEDVFKFIRSISYPNNKAKHLVGMAVKLLQDFNGEIPGTVIELETLPGVGRKTANVIASVVFNKPTMAVDTHVFRVSARIGLTTNVKNPLQAELQLIKNIPQELVPKAHHWLILHGRYICMARNPNCKACGISEWCKFFNEKSKKKLDL